MASGELLYQAVMKVPTLTGTWQQRNAQLYAKLGGASKYGAYNPTDKVQGLQQNSWLLNQINSNNYFNSWSTPAAATTPIAPQAAPPTPPPADSAELAAYLNEQQTQLDSIKNYDPFDGGSAADKIDQFTADTLGMKGEAPVAPEFEKTFEKLRVDMGLDNVEAGINEYKQMIREQENLLMQQKNTERGKTNRLGVIEGRIDKATTDRQEQISWLSSNVSYLTDVANSAYNYINMTMNFKNMDYNAAKEAYNTEFSQRMAIYDTIVTEDKDERDFQLKLRQEQQKVASTQLSMYADLISSGQMVWANMTSDEQLAIHKLEVQAGLPVGFTSRIQIPKGSTVKSVTNRTDASGNVYADILYIDPVTGAANVEHQLLGKTAVAKTSSGGTSSSTAKNSYGYTAAQWSSKLDSARGDLMSWEDASNKSITGDAGDMVLSKSEVNAIEKKFIAKYGEAGHALMVDSLNSGGYKLYNDSNGGALTVKWS